MLTHKIHQRIWGTLALQVPFQLLIVALNVLSSDFQTSGDTVQPRISYTYLQGLAQVLGSDIITVFFSKSFVFGEYKTDSPSKPAALVSFILRHH